MIPLSLSQSAAAELHALARSTANRPWRSRLLIVLMARAGYSRQQIASQLGLHPRSVTRWVAAYRAEGVDGLRPRKRTGRPAGIPDCLADEVRNWMERPAPGASGQTRRTIVDLADYLLRTHGVRASRTAVQRFCRKIGIRRRPGRPKKDPGRRGRERDAQAARERKGGRERP